LGRTRQRLIAAVAIAAALEACSHPSVTTYTPSETGTLMRVQDARIVSSRAVAISGLDNEQAAGWGTAIGAAIAGTSAYGITKADNPAGVAITVVAAIVGGLAGLAAEEYRETRKGAEYILRDDSGKTSAVVQSLGSGEKIFSPGTRVSLIYGARNYVRVVPAPEPSASPGPG
jgi:outer membrane lipoprotein SlyB